MFGKVKEMYSSIDRSCLFFSQANFEVLDALDGVAQESVFRVRFAFMLCTVQTSRSVVRFGKRFLAAAVMYADDIRGLRP